MKLDELKEVDHELHKNLIERRRNIYLANNYPDNELNKDQILMQPEEGQQKYEIKSVADASINERSFDNEGVMPMT